MSAAAHASRWRLLTCCRGAPCATLAASGAASSIGALWLHAAHKRVLLSDVEAVLPCSRGHNACSLAAWCQDKGKGLPKEPPESYGLGTTPPAASVACDCVCVWGGGGSWCCAMMCGIPIWSVEDHQVVHVVCIYM
jgi:hypothetical protein